MSPVWHVKIYYTAPRIIICIHFVGLTSTMIYTKAIWITKEVFEGCLLYIFEMCLRFIPHIKYLEAKRLKALALLKVLSHTSWGAGWTTLLKLYRSLVWSDYGCIKFGSARKQINRHYTHEKRNQEKGKDQESIQSSTTPNPGYQWESGNPTIRHHKQEPRGQPFPSRWSQGINKRGAWKHKNKTKITYRWSTRESPPWNGQ